VERFVTNPRHIEIQVFADTHGNCVHLFERDCSVQRRHQKVLEEAPAPGMSEARRAEMGAAAVAAAQAVGYVGAGTVEFIAEEVGDGDLRFYFMEMNTRLQVEHPVTEAVTGHDLVEWQLRVASGEPLPCGTQDALKLHGHAIEARICAENPDAQFLPATGTLVAAAWPAHVAFARNADGERFHEPAPVRIDRGFDAGDTITPHYDSMIAKLIVWGADRAQALQRLDAALRDTHLVGLQTNVAFLRRVVGTRAFATADLDTALIEREHAALLEAPPLAPELAAAGVIALAQHDERGLEDADPWSRRDGWRLHGGARRRFDLEIGGVLHAVTLTRLHDGATVFEIGDRRWDFSSRMLGGDGSRHDVTLGDRRVTLAVYRDGERVAVFAPEGSAVVTEIDLIAHAGDAAGDGGRLTAPMPGKVIALHVKAGDRVERGQAVAVMEAMKMEHTLHAPRDGEVGEMLAGVGDQVAEGTELLRLVAPPAAA
jgi:3-methylcrotonyl-CoA carboxylase alpha subunit